MPAPLIKAYPLDAKLKEVRKKERMLTMAQIQNIKFLRNYKELSLRKVAIETGYHFETVRKCVDKDNFNLPVPERHRRRGKLDPFKELIDQWLKDDLY